MPDGENQQTDLNAALLRFTNAVDALEVTIDRHLDGQRSLNEAEDEVQNVNSDRVELAESLDKSEARAARLESINKEVSHRLVSAMESIRGVIDAKTASESD